MRTNEPAAPSIDPRLLTGAVDIEDLEETGASFTPAIQEAYFDHVVSPPPEWYQ